MKWSGLPIIIIGTSGFSREVKSIIDEINSMTYNNTYNFLGFVAENEQDIGKKVLDNVVISSDVKLEEFISNYSEIGIVIPVSDSKIKKNILTKLNKYSNLVYPNIISPSAKILNLNSVELGYGNIIAGGVVLSVETKIGNFNLININSIVGHNTKIGDYCTINPSTCISGDVIISDEVVCGVNSSIKQGLTIGRNSIIGMGSFVISNVKENCTILCPHGRKLFDRN